MLAKKKLIRDIVYEYVYFTPLEAVIIESPVFQRLRFVSQNSSAYLTYPSNQLTRFSHSLGVMHLGGLIITSALKNTSNEDFWKLMLLVQEKAVLLLGKLDVAEGSISIFETQWIWGNISEFSLADKDIGKPAPELLKASPEFLINFLWQSIRIACLIHDIGHFPFSHVFEMGVENFRVKYLKEVDPIAGLKRNICKGLGIPSDSIKKPTELHEYFGAYILKDFLSSESQVKGDLHVLKMCLEFATEIFIYPHGDKDIKNIDDSGLMLTLHQVVSSFLDADRMDYVLRDSASSGLQIGNYDYRRIIDNVRVVKVTRESQGLSKQLYTLIITDKALSSVEQFYNHRYMLYEYLYFHHNVCKYDGVLMEIIAELLNEAVNLNTQEIQDILMDWKFLVQNEDQSFSVILADNQSISKVVGRYDDCWLRSMLQEIFQLISNSGDKFNKLRLLLDSFLFRNTDNTFSLIKKDADVDKFLEDFVAFLKEKNKNLHNSLTALKSKSINTFRLPLDTSDVKYLRYIFANYFKDDKDKHVRSEFIKRTTELCNDQFVFLYKDVTPKLTDEGASIFFNGSFVDCTQASPYLESFKQIKRTSFNHYLGFVAADIKLNFDTQKRSKEIAFEALQATLSSCLESEESEISLMETLSKRHF
jgi:HD superfamily phosphohydrolase